VNARADLKVRTTEVNGRRTWRSALRRWTVGGPEGPHYGGERSADL